MERPNIEKLLSDRFQARMTLTKAETQEERTTLMARIAELTVEIEKMKPSKKD